MQRENEAIKKSVLAEVEGNMKDGAILASNTSTISITELATSLKNPENFCGMHFFNPVHMMPLVEVIRAKGGRLDALATHVAGVARECLGGRVRIHDMTPGIQQQYRLRHGAQDFVGRPRQGGTQHPVPEDTDGEAGGHDGREANSAPIDRDPQQGQYDVRGHAPHQGNGAPHREAQQSASLQRTGRAPHVGETRS